MDGRGTRRRVDFPAGGAKMLSSKLSINQSNPSCFFECVVPAATLIRKMREPFDVLVEGFHPENSRGDRIPIELFLRAAASIEPNIRRLIVLLEQIRFSGER